MKQTDYDESVISVKKDNHRFRFYLNPLNGNIEFTLDGENEKTRIKEFTLNKIYFRDLIELYVGNDIEFVDNLLLSEEEATALRSAQKNLKKTLAKQNDRLKDWSLETKSKKDLLGMIDKHTVKVKTRQVAVGGVQAEEKYAMHTFKIGNETFRMIERFINGAVVVNPDYKLSSDYEKIGGVAAQEGELLVWRYYFEKEEMSVIDPSRHKGFWETAREMRYSERICYEIIMRYGYFHSERNVKTNIAI